MFPDTTCHHSEGWGPISRLRPFDLTPCFEEAVLFSVPLGSLIVLSLIRVYQLRKLDALQRTQKINAWLLWGKLVRGRCRSQLVSRLTD
jgi:ATP-binding cassette subfamily C (CFTR/MRP) protein 1